MRFFSAVLGVCFVAAAAAMMAAEPADKKESQTTKATYLITGLHCPPCTRTVESSLARVQGVRSAKVDWKTKNARIEFDEKVLPAQTLAQRIASTPHMMGSGMQYGGWLALKVEGLKEESTAKKAKETLGGVKGVKQVVAYPQQQSLGVQFDAQGKLATHDLIDALADAGIKATN
jgi:copper chaperone CopZ